MYCNEPNDKKQYEQVCSEVYRNVLLMTEIQQTVSNRTWPVSFPIHELFMNI